jgi:hypothetical protein
MTLCVSRHPPRSGGGRLVPLWRWRMLNEQEVGPAGLPFERYGSDHMALCVELEWGGGEIDAEWAPSRVRREEDW